MEFKKKIGIFLDTNILFSCLLYPNGVVAEAIYKACDNSFLLVTSTAVLQELERVLRRGFSVEEADKVLDDLVQFVNSKLFVIEEQVEIENQELIRDSDDVIILKQALSSFADYFMTGDHHFLDVREQIGEIQIITPREFLELDISLL